MHACLLRVAVTIGGVNLAGSPFEIHVNAGKTSACASHAEGSGWQRRVLVGDPLEFTIHAYDAQGNPQNQPTDQFVVTLTARSRDGYSIQLRPTYLGSGATLVKYEV